MNKVTKIDLVNSIFQKTGFDKQDVQNIIDCFLGEIKSSLESGSKIELRGFGTFEPRLRNGRADARNPKTGELVSVEPHYVAAFRAGQELQKNMWDLKITENDK